MTDLAQTCERLGRRDEARAARDRVLELLPNYLLQNPDDSRARMFYAVALAEMDKKEDALREGDQALEISPDDPLMLYNCACLYARLGESQRAIEALRQAIARLRELRLDEARPGLRSPARECGLQDTDGRTPVAAHIGARMDPPVHKAPRIAEQCAPKADPCRCSETQEASGCLHLPERYSYTQASQCPNIPGFFGIESHQSRAWTSTSSPAPAKLSR